MAAYPPGTPCWVELSSPDLAAAAAFYRAVFGWDAVEVGDPEQTGGYRELRLGDKKIAGLSPPWGESTEPGWTTYIAVSDADATAAAIGPAGGRVLMEPLDVFDAGRMAVFADAVGAVAGIWQPGEHTGADLVNRPGALCWNELATPRAEEARAFYRQVFGLEPVDVSAPSIEYWQFRAAGRPAAGLLPLREERPSRWVVCFVADDADATAERIEPAGGTLVTPPTDCEIGRYAEMRDPHGGFFQILRYSDEVRAAAEQSAAELGA